MDFEFASQRLQRDQQRMKKKTAVSLTTTGSTTAANRNTNNQAAVQLQRRRRHQVETSKRQQEKAQQHYQTQLVQRYLHKWEHDELHIQSLVDTTSISVSAVSAVSSPSQSKQLQLMATSIYGTGDKITLPPSILQRLLQLQDDNEVSSSSRNSRRQQQQQPWTFRIGIRNPISLQHPISTQLQGVIQQHVVQVNTDNLDEEEQNMDDDDEEEEEDDDDTMDMDHVDDGTNDNDATRRMQKQKQRRRRRRQRQLVSLLMNNVTPYLNEVQQYQYISYTHGTVMEFTQDEGYIGIPKSIADALLLRIPSSTVSSSSSSNGTTPNHNSTNDKSSTNNTIDDDDDDNNSRNHTNDTVVVKPHIEATRTVDPSANIAIASKEPTINMDRMEDDDDDDATTTAGDSDHNNNHLDQTPGHVAYGAFDIPAIPIEIVLLQLPMGTGMTLRPIMDNHQQPQQPSFYQLQSDQIKYALELSIQRTRATITLQDTLTTWYRGQEYTFVVAQLSPSNTYNAISCINTDIAIEFEPMMDTSTNRDSDHGNISSLSAGTPTAAPPMSVGRRLMDDAPSTTTSHKMHSSIPTNHISTTHQNTSTTDTIPSLHSPLPEPTMVEKENIITIQFRFTTTSTTATSDATTTTTTQQPQQYRRFNILTTTVQDLFHFVCSLSNSNDGTSSTNRSPTSIQLIRRYPRQVFLYSSNNNNTPMTLQQAGFQVGNELLIVEEI